jgi:hypothetical protein
VVEDPFAIPLERKIGDGIAYTESMYAAQRERKTFAASDGSFTEQTITHVGAAVEANAIEGDEHQRRSYPDAGGGWNAAGYEYIRGLDLAGRAGPLAEEAVELLTAPQCPSGRFTVILDPSQLYLQVHESCGHPAEGRPRGERPDPDRLPAALSPTSQSLKARRRSRRRRPRCRPRGADRCDRCSRGRAQPAWRRPDRARVRSTAPLRAPPATPRARGR